MNYKKIRKIIAAAVILTALFGTSIANAATTSSSKTFSWDNASVYFTLTDRFDNGDTSNDHSYGRGLDKNGNVQTAYNGNPGAFQGGDLKGLTQKVNDGYFNDLGINAIWITAPYEQVHGYTSGNDEGGNATTNSKGFPYYSYHGYWTLDYSNIDGNMGTAEDLKNFVDAAHAKGIRVVMDIVLNHVGYVTMKDTSEYNFGGLATGWENYYYGPLANLVGGGTEANTYFDKSNTKWASNWWGSDFIRTSAGFSGYPVTAEGAGYTNCLCGLPDIKTESTTEVALPPLLANKWKSEGRYDKEMASLNEFFAKRNLPKTPRNYVIKWLTDYIRQYGIDGFRCDTANQVDLDSWAALNKEARAAFDEYKAKNPDKVLDSNAEFWTVGESWGHGVNKDAFFNQGGFDAMINFGFKGANLSNLQGKYDDLNKVNSDDSFNVLSYISSHDDGLYNRANILDGGTALFLAPGAVQVFYGDETARPLAWTDRFRSDYKDQCYRSFMNWGDLNDSNSLASKALAHWQKLGQFRNNHISVGAGVNTDMSTSPYTFSRVYNKNNVLDKVVCEVGGTGTIPVNVSGVFGDGALVRDAYTGKTAKVSNGTATFTDGGNKVILIEKGDNTPEVSVGPSKTSYFTDTLDLTLYVSGADSGTYSINNGEVKSFVNGDKVPIGAGLEYEAQTKITVNAKNSDGTATQTYTYTKKNPNFISQVFFRKPSTWGAPKAYVYSESTGNKVAAWPGLAMKSEGGDLYSYSLPAGFSDALVIFTDGSNQTPGVGMQGLSLEDGSKMEYENGTWKIHEDDLTKPVISISKEDCTFTDSLTLTLGAKNSTSSTYSIDGGEAKAYTDGQTITIGQDAEAGDKVTVTLTAINGTNIVTRTYIYTKPVVVGSEVYFNNSNNWSNPFAYVYSGSGATTNKIAAWPGVAMTKVNDGLYNYKIPEGFGDAKVIFSNKGNSQYPGSGQEGLAITVGSSMEYKNGTWKPYEEVTTGPAVSISKEDCTFEDSLTLTLGAKNVTSATYSINGEEEEEYKDGQTVTIGQEAEAGAKITLTIKATDGTKTATKTYTYTKVAVASTKIYFYNTNNWSNPYVYVYSGSGATANKVAAWPGVAMTKVSDGLYSYTIPKGFGDAKVIFSNKGNSQYPGSGQEGLVIKTETSMAYNNGNWGLYTK
jgi:alpha-amylase